MRTIFRIACFLALIAGVLAGCVCMLTGQCDDIVRATTGPDAGQ